MRTKCFVLFFVFILSFENSNSQNPLKFEQVFNAEGKTKDEMFSKAMLWVADKYNSANDVVQLSDKDAGNIIVKAMYNHRYGKAMTYGGSWGNITYTLSIQFKDDKYRIAVGPFIHEYEPPKTMISISYGLVTDSIYCSQKWGKKKMAAAYWSEIKKSCEIKAYEIFASLSDAIDKKEEW